MLGSGGCPHQMLGPVLLPTRDRRSSTQCAKLRGGRASAWPSRPLLNVPRTDTRIGERETLLVRLIVVDASIEFPGPTQLTTRGETSFPITAPHVSPRPNVHRLNLPNDEHLMHGLPQPTDFIGGALGGHCYRLPRSFGLRIAPPLGAGHCTGCRIQLSFSHCPGGRLPHR
ncbi:hypothetical protein NDU88_005470 [Pleurodeles waltl]|uniref:Uncharacterized protein n=1 Tax=Pleurodeles waltl TaxID=8319 RepID=A0AAV7PGY0_PLEWA|nr:hypothetical protein NDU88_005470 [Pleurodeles waltl]